MIPWAWLSGYAKRRAIGLCGAECCKEPADGLCLKHKRQKKENSRVWNREEYLRKKVNGDCVAKGCRERASETSVYCAEDLAIRCGLSHRYRKTKKGRERRRAGRRAWVKRRTELGICTVGLCPNELETTTMCHEHRVRSAALAAARRRKSGIPEKMHVCHVCKQLVNHNAITCTGLVHDADMPSVEHYANARSYIEIG